MVNRFNVNKTEVDKIVECIVENGTGVIPSSLIPADIFSTLTSLQTTYSSVSTLTSTYGSGITKLYETLSTMITAYK